MSRWFSAYGFADVHDDLIVGAYPLDEADVATLAHLGVTRVLNLVQDEEYTPGQHEAVALAFATAGIEESRLRLVDYGHLPAVGLEDAVQRVVGWLDEGERIYVHCRAGWQRSPAVAVAVVAVAAQIDLEDALRRVQRRKPSANPLPHQREELWRWWEARAELTRPHEGDAP